MLKYNAATWKDFYNATLAAKLIGKTQPQQLLFIIHIFGNMIPHKKRVVKIKTSKYYPPHMEFTKTKTIATNSI